MKSFKKILSNIFIDGLSGMALGLFSTLIIGTILKQIGDLMGGTYGHYLSAFAVIAQRLTGAGIGIGKIGGQAMDAMARQPEKIGDLRSSMIIAAALVEGVAFFAVIIALLALFV